MPASMKKLGRKAVKTDSRTLRLARYLLPTLAPPPVSIDWTKGIMAWGVLMNDTLGDCTCAGVGHAVQVFSANTGKEAAITDAQALAAYEAWCGYNPSDPSTDQGGIELDVLTDWKAQGFSGHKLLAFADPQMSNHTEVQQSIALFGGAYIGMNVPNFIMNNIPELWDVTANDGGIDGGHCVFVCGYDAAGLTFISWGNIYKMTWTFWDKYVDEAHALISADFIAATGLDPSGFDLAQLEADLSSIT